MIPDKWLTVEEAEAAIMEIPNVVKIAKGDSFIVGQNKHTVGIIRVRIFTGDEHELAQAGMVLDWRTHR